MTNDQTPSEPTREPYTCPRCKMTSHSPEDARWRYCGNCRAFEDDAPTGRENDGN